MIGRSSARICSSVTGMAANAGCAITGCSATQRSRRCASKRTAMRLAAPRRRGMVLRCRAARGSSPSCARNRRRRLARRSVRAGRRLVAGRRWQHRPRAQRAHPHSGQVLRKFPRSHLAWILMLGKQGKVAEARRELSRARAACCNRPAAPSTTRRSSSVIARTKTRRCRCEECAALAARAAPCRRTSTCCARPTATSCARCTSKPATYRLRCRSATMRFVTIAARAPSSAKCSSTFTRVAPPGERRLRDAEALLRQAWTSRARHHGPNTETEAVAACMLAVALYEKGDIDEAETLLTPALAAIGAGRELVRVAGDELRRGGCNRPQARRPRRCARCDSSHPRNRGSAGSRSAGRAG